MKSRTYKIELLTPCFCAGANQAQAEIRAPSIRGQLRWWFRALGGTAEQEKTVFGGVHPLKGEKKENAARSSRVVIRISDVAPQPAWQPFSINPNAPESYIWYYASASAQKSRWTKAGNISPGTTFSLHVTERLDGIPADLQQLFDQSIEAFLRFGCIGLRSTRGLGSLHPVGLPNSFQTIKESARRLLETKGFAVQWKDTVHQDMRGILAEAGDILKNQLRANCKVTQNRYSPLGNSDPRHASAVHLRPVKCADGLRLLIFEAPHARILPQQAQRPKSLITT